MSRARRPRPLRAMMSAHLRSHWVGTRRQSGSVGRWARIAVGGGVMLAFLVGIAGGMGTLGWHVDGLIGRHRASGQALLASALSAYVLLFGVTASMEGVTRRLPWDQLRVFPVHTRTLFLAELCASALDVVSLIPVLGLLAFCTTASMRHPAATPAYALLFFTHALLLLTLPLVLGGILQRGSRNLRLTLTVLPMSVLTVGSFSTVKVLDSVSSATRDALIDRMRSAGSLLPSHALVSAATGLARGELSPLHGLPAALGSLAVALGLLAAAYRMMLRERPMARRNGGADARLWTFRQPVWGVARLQWAMLLGSMQGRFALAFPLIALSVSGLGGFGRSKNATYVVSFAFIYCSFGLVGLLSNQFGLDRHGVKVLLLLPIAERTLLRGKLLGHALLAAAQAAILALLIVALRMAPVAAVGAGIATYGCMFVLLAMVGTPCSVWAPRPIRAHGTRNPPPLRMLLVLLGAVPVCGALVGGVLFVTCVWHPGWELGVALALFVALLGVFELLLGLSARHLVRNRERLIEQLSGASV